jgi:hypothetical protein
MRNEEVPGEGESPVITGLSVYGARGTRTPDLLGAIQALSQLSYSPEEPTVYPRDMSARATGMARNRRYAQDR